MDDQHTCILDELAHGVYAIHMGAEELVPDAVRRCADKGVAWQDLKNEHPEVRAWIMEALQHILVPSLQDSSEPEIAVHPLTDQPTRELGEDFE